MLCPLGPSDFTECADGEMRCASRCEVESHSEVAHWPANGLKARVARVRPGLLHALHVMHAARAAVAGLARLDGLVLRGGGGRDTRLWSADFRELADAAVGVTIDAATAGARGAEHGLRDHRGVDGAQALAFAIEEGIHDGRDDAAEHFERPQLLARA